MYKQQVRRQPLWIDWQKAASIESLYSDSSYTRCQDCRCVAIVFHSRDSGLAPAEASNLKREPARFQPFGPLQVFLRCSASPTLLRFLSLRFRWSCYHYINDLCTYPFTNESNYVGIATPCCLSLSRYSWFNLRLLLLTSSLICSRSWLDSCVFVTSCDCNSSWLRTNPSLTFLPSGYFRRKSNSFTRGSPTVCTDS